MAKSKKYQGTSRINEIRADLRRDDARSIFEKLSDALDTPNGTMIYFISIAFLVASIGLIFPFSGEIGLLTAIMTLLSL